eukprot:scaffold46374_cov31-Attheya_sp.AAC.1
MVSTWEAAWAVPHNKAPMGLSQDDWTEKDYSSTKFIGLVLESGPGFKRTAHPVTGRPGNVLLMHFDMVGKDFIFANCLKCKARKFDDPEMSFPLDLPIDDPTLPRLGKCGCVCCNGCIRKLIPVNINTSGNPYRGYIPCPYSCKYYYGHKQDQHAWIFTESMLNNLKLSGL